MVSGRTRDVSAAVRYLNPSRTPTTSSPWLTASITTELMTPLIPGAGPPPTTIATFPRIAESAMVRNASKGRGRPGEGDERPRGRPTLRIGNGGAEFKGSGAAA